MENEKVETPNEEVETSENNEVVETTEVVETDDAYSSKTIEDYKALEKKNKELFERAKKAEEAAKKLKATPVETNKPNTESTISREEVILLAKGVPEEDVEILKKLQAGSAAIGKPISLAEASNDPVYLAFKRERDAKEKKAKAQLGASNGSSVYQDSRNAVNMSEAEHRKLFEQSLKR